MLDGLSVMRHNSLKLLRVQVLYMLYVTFSFSALLAKRMTLYAFNIADTKMYAVDVILL